MINIAIDGPAGAGKSTIAKAVAKDLGIIYLDTGAMYRATAYLALQKGIDVKDEEKVAEMLEDLTMDIKYDENGAQRIIVNGIDATPYLREHYMSKAASDISALPCVRYKMVDLQRDFASKNDVVLDGRDIGTFVLPNANCKFFLTATPQERAERRMKDLQEKGETVDFDQLLQDIIQRDYNDSHREVAPLKQADDADYVDTTSMSIDDVVAHVKEVVHIKTKKADSTVQNNEKQPSTIIPSSEMDKKTLARIKTYYKKFCFLQIFESDFAPDTNARVADQSHRGGKCKKGDRRAFYLQPLFKNGFDDTILRAFQKGSACACKVRAVYKSRCRLVFA